MGSVVATTGSDGAIQSQARYYPYGQVSWSSGASPTDRTYTGQKSTDFGLMDYNARMYDPTTGRFISPDTLIPDPKNPKAFDRYAYVMNNPINYNDPLGLFTKKEIQNYYGVDKWDDVLQLFNKGGELEGRWGWLQVLQKAEIGDDINIKWDKAQLPKDHPEVGDTFKGKFDKDITGNLIITGDNYYMDQMKAGKYGADYQLMHYTSNNGKKASAAFIIAATDITVGIPAFILMLSGQPPVMKASEMLETFVVLPVNVLGIKMWRDADHDKLEEVLNISAIRDPDLPNLNQER